MVQFLPLDVTDEESIGIILSHVDNAIQSVCHLSLSCSPCSPSFLPPTFFVVHPRYGESEEPKEPKDMDQGDFDVGE